MISYFHYYYAYRYLREVINPSQVVATFLAFVVAFNILKSIMRCQIRIKDA